MNASRKIPHLVTRCALALCILAACLANQGGCFVRNKVVRGIDPSSIAAGGAGQMIEKEGPGIKHRSRERDRLLADPDYNPDQNPYPPGDPRNPAREQGRQAGAGASTGSRAPTGLGSHSHAPPAHSHH
jgi:hypothetical protein